MCTEYKFGVKKRVNIRISSSRSLLLGHLSATLFGGRSPLGTTTKRNKKLKSVLCTSYKVVNILLVIQLYCRGGEVNQFRVKVGLCKVQVCI